jgi:hypothetical protein
VTVGSEEHEPPGVDRLVVADFERLSHLNAMPLAEHGPTQDRAVFRVELKIEGIRSAIR